MAQQPLIGQRKFLNDNGYTDDQIKYNNGEVLLNGKHFSYANPQQTNDVSQGLVKGSTYGTQSDLANYLSNYKVNNAPKTDTSTTDNSTDTNPVLDKSKMLNDSISNINSQTNSTPFQFKSPAPFSYDATTDPQYVAALALAKGNIQTGQNNTMANLIAHGQGNSSYSTGVAQQIADKEIGNVNNNLLPSFVSQAYQRYQDGVNNDFRNQSANYGVGQDQLKNQLNLSDFLNNMNQQKIANNFTESGLTGYYKDPNALSTDEIQSKMKANSDAYAAATPEEQAKLHDENVGLAKLLGGTYDSKSGTYSYDPNNIPQGVRTLQGQQTDLQKSQLDAQNAQQTWDNAFKDKQFDYQKASDLWDRTFKEDTFKQSVTQFAQSIGVDYAKLDQSQQQFVADMAFKDKLNTQANDPNTLDNKLKQSQIDKNNAPTDKFNLDDYKGYINQQFFPEKFDIKTGTKNKVFDVEAAKAYINGLSIPESSKQQLNEIYNIKATPANTGLSDDAINKFLKKK